LIGDDVVLHEQEFSYYSGDGGLGRRHPLTMAMSGTEPRVSLSRDKPRPKAAAPVSIRSFSRVPDLSLDGTHCRVSKMTPAPQE
jgi:hypothetical protein